MPPTRAADRPDSPGIALARGSRSLDRLEEVALVAAARRAFLLRTHRFRLRHEDLEDCYGQATLELLKQAREGRSFANRRHLASVLEQRFVSRINDRRRALSGRSPMQAALEGAVPLGPAPEDHQLQLADSRADLERLVLLRNDLRRLRALAQQLTEDQRLVLATQLAQFYRAGLRPLAEIIRENPLAQDYVDWGDPGPGRWVTIYAAAAPIAHVFIVIAGLRLDTSHDGTDEGPNRLEGGPRWRIFGRIPDWERWSVRHPPGL